MTMVWLRLLPITISDSINIIGNKSYDYHYHYDYNYFDQTKNRDDQTNLKLSRK